MKETEFRRFLENQQLSDNGVAYRLSRGRAAEEILGYSLDTAISSDDMMYDSLVKLVPNDDSSRGKQNALRKYYTFIHGKEFPKLDYYKR